MSLSVRPSFKINLLKGSAVRITMPVKNAKSKANNAPVPNGDDCLSPPKKFLKSIIKNTFQTIAKIIIAGNLIGKPPFD